MSIRNASAFLIGMVVVALAALACSSEAPTPTTTPTPPASAQDVAAACTKATASPYLDLHVSTVDKYADSDKSDGFIEVKLRLAGADFQMDARGEIVGERFQVESIYVDGVGYYRENAGPWQIDKSLTPDFLAPYYNVRTPEGDWSVCPDVTTAEKVGEESLGGVTTTRYMWEFDKDLMPGAKEDVVNYRWDFWVDETGLLQQIRKVESYTATKDYGAGSVTELTTISGVGEPNTITAPTIP